MKKSSLQTYHEKRRFAETPEPRGRVFSSGKNRFSIQEHHARRLHYDLRLEMDGVLKSWALPKGLPEEEKEKHLAMMTEDHPVDYIDFEGIIPQGNYGAGRVVLWEIGTYRIVTGSIEEGKLTFLISGRTHQGEYTLVKTSLKGEKNAWLIIKTGKPHFPSGKNPIPSDLLPMRASLAEASFEDPAWVFEEKWDGVRAVAKLRRGKEGAEVELWGRNLSHFEVQYPEVIEKLGQWLIENPAVESLIVDGEIVAFDPDGKVSFQVLQRRMHLTDRDEITMLRREVPVQYIVFDLLYMNGASLLQSPLWARRDLLSKLHFPEDRIKVSALFENGAALFKSVQERGGEGMIAKKKESRYLPGERSREWIKVKRVQEQECVVTGWTEGRGNRSHTIGALLLGLYDGKELKYVGHTGTGFDFKTLEVVQAKLAPLETKECPFETRPKTNARPHWANPALVAQIRFSNWTEERHMRAPVFLGLRTDIAPEECRFEQPLPVKEIAEGRPERIWIGNRLTARFEGNEIEVTHLDKVLWPKLGYTKAHMIDYYMQVSEWLVPHLVNRPLTLVRFPNGINGESFYQKNWKEKTPPWVKQILIPSGDEKNNMILCNNASTLVWLANLADIELHPWLSRADAGQKKLDRPDFVVFDIDPPKEKGESGVSWERFEQAIEAALWLKKILDEGDIRCFLKTTGKSGLHIFVPIDRKYGYAETRQFSKKIAERLQADHPAQITTTWRIEKREKKVLVDYNQNAEGKTLASLYSLRATEEATISVPVTWKELPKISPLDFTLETVPARLKKVGDLWKTILESPQRLEKAIKALHL